MTEEKNQRATIEVVGQNIGKVLAELEARFNLNPNDENYPIAVAIIGSPRNDGGTILQYQLTAVCNHPSHPNGWPQALTMTRDLLMFAYRLDQDNKLGLSLLPAVMAQHPMLQKYIAPPPTPPAPIPPQPKVENKPDGTRVVTDAVEARSEMAGGVGGEPTKH